MSYVFLVLFVLWVWLDWRDRRSDWARGRRWSVEGLSRRRAIVISVGLLLMWMVVALGIGIEMSRPTRDRSFFLMIPTMVLLQMGALRRSELFRPAGEAGAGLALQRDQGPDEHVLDDV